ncbi:MAG: LamG-like jellyroll fold domain-containing protein, partial [SAR324 cluster bacterium]|nr:LamG-like jellyroll fold domain-containing protein [SAR324 cluster bacterium]
SCAFNKAAYFDSTTGYLENDNFTQTNIPNLSGNFSIALWVNPTAGMYNRNAAVMNSGWDNQNNFQIDSDFNNRFDWDNSETNRPVYQPYTANQWYYLVAVKYDNGTAALYVDGLLSNPPAPNVGTVHNFTTRWDGLALGLARSRTAAAHWKGYVDEFKVYRRSLSAAEVRDKCLGYAECNDLPPNKPTNLVAEGGSRSGQIELSWDNMTGADNYTVYWTDTPSTPINPADPSTYDNSTVVTTTSTSIANLTNGQPYDFTVVAHNAAGNSTPAEEANATPSIPTVGVTVTQSDNSTSVIEEGQIGYTYYTALLGTPQDDVVRAMGSGAIGSGRARRLYLKSKGQYNDLMATGQRVPSFSGSYPPNLAPHAQQYERGSRGHTIYPRFNRTNGDQTVVISATVYDPNSTPSEGYRAPWNKIDQFTASADNGRTVANRNLLGSAWINAAAHTSLTRSFYYAVGGGDAIDCSNNGFTSAGGVDAFVYQHVNGQPPNCLFMIGSAGTDYFTDFVQGGSSGTTEHVYLVGTTDGAIPGGGGHRGGKDGFIVKILGGSVVAVVQFGGPGDEEVGGISKNPTTNFTLPARTGALYVTG